MSYMLFKVNEFKEYKLRLTMQNIITLEATFNKNFYDIMADFISGSVNLEVLLQILKESMMTYGYVTCDNDVYNIYDEYVEEGHTMQDLFMLVFEILKHAGFFEDNVAEENNDIDDSTYPMKEGENPTSMDRCFFDLRDKALECGMDEDRYWNSTYGEVIRCITSYSNRFRRELKLDLRSAHLTADLVGVSVARLFGSDVEFPDITELYPELFKEEIEELKKIEERDRLIKLRENLANLAKVCVPVNDDNDNDKKGE